MTAEERTYEDYSEREWTRRGRARKRKYKIICAATVTVVLLVLAVTFVRIPEHSLYWHIDKGDEFTFSIIYHLDMNESLTDPEYFKPWLRSLNETSVTFQVIDLPHIPPSLNADNFIDLIMGPIKSSCTFVNGTAVPEPYNSTLNTLFSSSLLPAGDWDFIDSLFNESSDMENTTEELQYEYTAWSHNNMFYMTYNGYSNSEMRGWWCHIDMNTGLPVMIEDYIDTFDSSGFAMYSLMLIPA